MTGIAILTGVNPETREYSIDVFREDDDTAVTWSDGTRVDPYHRANALRESVAPDFPDRLWSIALNDRAKDLMRDARMKQMGLD